MEEKMIEWAENDQDELSKGRVDLILKVGPG